MISTAENMIYAVGVGVNPALHLSRRAEKIIASASCIGYFQRDEVERVLTDVEHNALVVELDYLYESGGDAEECRAAVCEFVIQLAKQHRRVVIIFPGNPMFGVSLTQMISSLTDQYEFGFEVVPAISSYSTTEVEVRGEVTDAAVIDVGRWLLFDLNPDLSISYYVYFLHHAAHSTTGWDALQQFQMSLLKAYPADHHCYLVRSCRPAGLGGGRFKLGIAELTRERHRIEFDSTLVIPPVHRARNV